MRIPKKVIENLREELSRGCEYTGTEEVVHDTFLESMEEIGAQGDWDELSITDLNDNDISVQDLFETFYDKMIEKVLIYIEA